MPIAPVDLPFTPVETIPETVESLRKAFAEDKTLSYEWRRKQIIGINKLVTENEKVICEALKKDLSKPNFETIISECGMIQVESVHAYDSLKEWMKPHKPSVPIQYIMDTCMIQRQPYGVTLIIAPWNYPVQLLLAPLIGAVAAGNTVVLKPSELAPNIALLLTELIPKYLDSDCIKIVNGSVKETEVLLAQKFDYIFYTGGPKVARVIMNAAAKNLTPVTLELGGKSPVFIDSTADIAVAARRICWGKFINTGQTCIAPDYVICDKTILDSLLKHISEVLKKMYGENAKESADYGRIINRAHFDRLAKLICKDNVAFGGETDESQLYIAPTVLKDINYDSPVMESEIFGPILPIIAVDNVKDGVAYVASHDKPLVMYVFSRNEEFISLIEQKTSSGGLVVNDTLMHVSVCQLPFGGVGESGMGKYHGEESFLTFSHQRAVMKRSYRLEELNDMRYAPYTDEKLDRIRSILFPRKLEEKEGFFASFGSFFRSSSSSQINPPRTQESPVKVEEKVEEEVEEKVEEKVEEEVEEKVEEKAEEKVEEKVEEKAEEKVEEKAEEKAAKIDAAEIDS